MGVLRDLKKATEAYWGDKISRDDLIAEGKRLRLAHWKIQKDAGIDIIPSNDFSFYDQVLDHIQLFGVRSLALDCLTIVADSHVRPFLSGIPNTNSMLLTSSSPWAEAYKSLTRTAKQLMFQRWRW